MKAATLITILCTVLLFSCRKTEPPAASGDNASPASLQEADLLRSPDYRGLIQEYRMMLAEDPKNMAALVALGNAYFDNGQWRAAVSMYEHALALDPRNADVHTDRGTALRNLGLADQAIEEYRRAIELEPGHLDARYNLGVVFAYDKKDRRAALHIWDELLKMAPNYRNARLIHEHIASLQQRPQKAAP